MSRRGFLGSISAATLLPAGMLAGLCRRAGAAEQKLSAEPLADGLVWIRGAGANLLALRDGDGLLFIDGGLEAHAAEVLKLAQQKLGAGRANTLFNTHWHHEHTGLNERLGKAGATIIAHEQTRLWLSTKVRYQPDDPPILPLPLYARPNKTTWTGGELQAGGQQLIWGYMAQAHTDGDIYVKLAAANVLVTGGVVAGNGWPTPDWVTGGYITGTVNGYRTLLAQCDDATRVVTAYGDRLYTRADLQTEFDILSKLNNELSKMMRAGFGPQDMLAAEPAKDYAAQLGDPTHFLMESFKSLWPRLAPDA
ncbi:MAG TPA: MBL fold metallo-hydrolase [Steroidobacteraceae bacterium]|nr:MBL fold metallo-hydrolase [Steroidobacteraceae bacterium]